jgi:hypothetical protein
MSTEREGFVFLNDMFWKCFQQDVDPSEISGAERDDEKKGWWVPEKSLYQDKDYEEPSDEISKGGLAEGVTRK